MAAKERFYVAFCVIIFLVHPICQTPTFELSEDPIVVAHEINGRFEPSSSNQTIWLHHTTIIDNVESNTPFLEQSESGDLLLSVTTVSRGLPEIHSDPQGYSGNNDVWFTKLKGEAPVIDYARYIGGTSQDWVSGICSDEQGNAFLVGVTYSDEFPQTEEFVDAGANAALGGAVYVMKIAPEEGMLDYSRLLGGNASDWAEAMTLGPNGHLYIMGGTDSGDFPILGENAENPWFSNFFCELNETGHIVYSTFFEQKLNAFETEIGKNGNIYTIGFDSSEPNPNPLYLSCINASANSVIWQTTLASNRHDVTLTDLVVDTEGTVHTCGFSSDSPQRDIIVMRINSIGELVYSKRIGGNGIDSAWGIDVDASGNTILCGSTESSDFPVLGEFDSTLGVMDAYVMSFDPLGEMRFATLLGGLGLDNALSVSATNSGEIWVAGRTDDGRNFPAMGEYKNYFSEYPFHLFITKLSNTSLTEPILNEPFDIELSEGIEGQFIEWIAHDNNPKNFTTSIDSIPVDSSPWNQTIERFRLDIPILSLGEHNATILINDLDSNSASDTVLFAVSPEVPPIIYPIQDIECVYGQAKHIVWEIFDLELNLYRIYRDDVLVDSGSLRLEPDLQEVWHDIAGVAAGTYDYTLVVWDLADYAYKYSNGFPCNAGGSTIHFGVSHSPSCCYFEKGIRSFELNSADAGHTSLFLTRPLLQNQYSANGFVWESSGS
ncbi:MAG: SBBP repeat-containing protein [Candidatus Thorarchaeota archaeon]